MKTYRYILNTTDDPLSDYSQKLFLESLDNVYGANTPVQKFYSQSRRIADACWHNLVARVQSEGLINPRFHSKNDGLIVTADNWGCRELQILLDSGAVVEVEK